jgi:alpha-tubulin suppressor-like RCC1 family protein
MPVTVGSVAGRRVVDVSAGATNTLCVCDDGTLHACGDNRLGQAGLGDVERAEMFTQVPLPSGLFARQVRSGEAHSLVLCDDGTLLGFGRNQLGQVTPGKKDRYVKEPIVVELEGSVLSVAVGRAHNVVLVS